MADPYTIRSTATSVVGSVEQSILARIKPHIKRALNAERNLDDLKSQVEKLKNAKETVQGLVDEARDSQGRAIHQHVEKWLTEVEPWTRDDRFTGDEGNAMQRCFIGCPNYIMRYQISVKVEEGAKEVADLLEEAARYDAVEKISRRPRALATRVMSIRNYEASQSRTSVIKQIVDALASSGKNLIGLYGMGGVGKTTLLKIIGAQVLEEELFDKVVFCTITANPNVEAIQEEIAESLRLKIEEKNEGVRANRLRDKLKQEKKILVILDDLWGRIDLEAIGIPFPDQQKGLKILMTSRNEHVLSRQMGAEETFELQVLVPDEAWDLFQKMVGDVKDPSVRSIAEQVAERCEGLPVLLATVARALRGADLNDWKDALNQLSRPKDNEFAEQVYSALELTYKSLRSDDARSLFLLCGYLWPQRISVDYLLKYGRGLGLFESSRTLEEARIRLYKLVKELKASSLLLDDNEGFVRMRDPVHNFAAKIASSGRPFFKVSRGSELRWPSDDTLRQCSVINLNGCKIPDFPVTLDCPKLELLLLDGQDSNSLRFPDSLFIRMKESLKVMDLTRFHFPRLPVSIQSLENLQTLCLDQCFLEDIRIIGALKKLQVLSFWGSDIVELPKEIGQLAHLQSLDLSNCWRLAVIPPDVLSCLTKLEDLFMENVDLQWDIEEQSRRKNASLAELKHLQKLVTLDVHITDANMWPKGLFFEKLERFRIFVGEGWDWSGEYETSRTLKLKLNASTPLAEGLKLLLCKSGDLYLQGVEGVSDDLKVFEVLGSSELEHLNIHNCLDIEFLANSPEMGQPRVIFSSLKTLLLFNLNNLKKICHGQTVFGSFCNLRVLKVRNCDKLKYLISLSMARGLSLLTDIEVLSCKIMEKIVVQEGEDGVDKDEQIQWNLLHSLTLQELPQLESFCSEFKGPLVQEINQMSSPTDERSYDVHDDEPETASQPSTKKACFRQLTSFCCLSKTRNKELVNNSNKDEIVHGTPVPLTSRKVHIVFPHLEELKLSSLKVENLCDSSLVDLSSCSKKLTILIVRGCDNLRSLFTYSMVKSLSQLKKLEICDCELLEEVIVTDEGLGKGDMGGEIPFPQLDFLKVKGLQQLVRFCLSNLFIFSSLKTLWIESCPKLKAFVSSPAKTADMTANTEPELTDSILFDQKVAFPELEELRIVQMDTLKKIWRDQLYEDSFGRLKTLKVEHAATLQNVFPSNVESRFKSLENLFITDCDSLIELFDMSPMVVAQLKTLRIRGLPSLKSLFPVSIATVQLCLEEIDVANCGIEEIIKKREGIGLGRVPVFRFPCLTRLRLWNLWELKGFYLRRHISEWPMLKCLIMNYDKMALFDWESKRSEKARHLEIQPFFSARKVIPNLEELTLNCKDLEFLSDGQVTIDLFSEVNFLLLPCVHDRSAIFPVDLLQRYFYNLKSLHMGSSTFNTFEEIASPDLQIFPSMGFLRLEHIYNLKHFWKQDSQTDCLQNLETLEIWQCHNFTNLSLLSSSFQSLTNLDVYECHGLVNLFTPSMAKCLVQLAEISIRECNMVREVVANEGDNTEDEILFSKLETLKFSCLARLTSFCPGSCRIKFQSLVKVIVRQCPEMRTFSAGVTSTPKLQKVQVIEDEDRSHWMGDLNATVQQLYNEGVRFRGLKSLKLSEYPELKDVWQSGLTVEFFSDLTSLVVDDCPFLSHAISPALMPILKDLEKLEVENCHSLEGLSYLEKLNANEENIKLLSRLRELWLTNLPMLDHLWTKDSQAIFKPKNLCVLKVDNCSSLRNVFTQPVAVGFEKLKMIEIRNCAVMRAILMADSEDASVGKIVIPALESLVLCSLPNLTSVYSGSGILELPSLKEITIDCCPKMKAFVSSTLRVKQPRIVDEETEETLFEAHADDSAALLFDDKTVFPMLEELELVSINMKTLWHGPFEAVKSSIQNLRILSVGHCDSLKYLFTSSMVGCLTQLGYLSVRDCDEMEEIILTEEALTGGEGRINENEIVFSKLDALHLSGLPKLKRFCTASRLECPLLKDIKLWKCHALKTFVSNSCFESKTFVVNAEHREEDSEETQHGKNHPLFDAKVSFPRLAGMKIEHLDNLEKIWNKDPKETLSFQKLQSVTVSDCPVLKNIFPSSIAKDLMQLEDLKIKNCAAVEEIVAKDRNLRGIPCFKFAKLSSLTLEKLPTLKNFYPGQHTSEWPVLKELEVTSCVAEKLLVTISSISEKVHGDGHLENRSQQPVLGREQDIKLGKGQEMAQDNVTILSRQLSSNLDASQDQAGPREKLPFSSNMPTSNIETAKGEDDLPQIESQEGALKDLYASDNPGFNTDLHQEIETISEVIIEEKARRNALKTPGTAQYVSTDIFSSEILNDKDPTPGQISSALENQEPSGSVLVQKDPQATAENEPPKHQAIVSPVSAQIAAEQAPMSISEHPSKTSSFGELTCLQGQDGARDNLTTSSRQLTLRLEASQEKAVPQHKLLFSSTQPNSNFETVKAEKNKRLSAYEELALEDLCAMESLGSSKDMHQEIETTPLSAYGDDEQEEYVNDTLDEIEQIGGRENEELGEGDDGNVQGGQKRNDGFTSASKECKQSKRGRRESGAAMLSQHIAELGSTVQIQSVTSRRSNSPGWSIFEVLNDVQQLPGIDTDSPFYMFCTELLEQQSKREVYVTNPTPLMKLRWLQYNYEKQNK